MKKPIAARAIAGLKCSFCGVPQIEDALCFADAAGPACKAIICLDCLRTANSEIAKCWTSGPVNKT